jgi:regulator of replication initiation timing
MPKGKSKKNQEINQNPVENTTPVVNETPNENPVVETETPEVSSEETQAPTVEETQAPVEEIIETEKSPLEIFQSGLEEPIVPEPVVEAPKKGKELSQRQMFEKAIETKPFQIFQNGIVICHHSDYVGKITVADKYFEIAFRKFSYDGIEIKYI